MTPLPADATLREVVERLAALERSAGSPGEREAAEWLVERLRAAGARNVVIEEETTYGTFPPTLIGLGLAQIAGAALVFAGRRGLGTLLALASAAGIVDEAQNGPRLLRRAVRRKRTTPNVVAEAGDPDGERTLVVLGHHDAAQAGRMFDQTLQKKAYERWPERMDQMKTSFPQWWIGLAGPPLIATAAATGRKGPAVAAAGIAGLGVWLSNDIRTSPVVPGANDNLSAVAAIVALAEMLRDHPIPGLRVLLVSAGAEETLQDGIRGFMARHRDALPTDRTWVLNLDTVGSEFLILPEGEGPVWMEEYHDPSFRDLVAERAEALGISMERGFRLRSSTDSVIPSRAGYPSALLLSIEQWRAPANYHMMSDTPENLDYGTVAEATRLTYAVAEALASA